MNYSLLADLLYPNVKYTPEQLEQMYPKRNLPAGALVTRIAPSPTGYMHIGNFFSAFLDWQIARTTGGKFFFRLEDTDKKREVSGSGLVAISMLYNYGLIPDEGLTNTGKQKGEYGPYVQSERIDIYYTYAKELVKKGRAFPCFCQKTESLEQIKQRRQELLEQEEDIVEKDVCRNLTFEQIEQNIRQGKPFALRLKSNGEKDQKITTHDLVRGTRELGANCKDVILIKTDGIPPYAFAHAVDDHLMRTSVVVRGEEWYASFPAHLEIFDALGFERLNYIHTPNICKLDETTGNKRKLSKRKDPEADMRYFDAQGYPKEALLEYLLTLANSNFEIWRLENPDKSLFDFAFTIEKIGNSNPMFDLVKLNDISKNIIAKMSAQQVFERLTEYAKQYDQEFYNVLTTNKDYALKVLSIDRGGEKPRKDFATWSNFKTFFDYMFGFKKFETIQDYDLTNINTQNALLVLEKYVNIYDATHTKEQWFAAVKQMSEQLGFATDNKLYKANPQAYKGNVADVCNYIRIAITGKQNSPDLHLICSILGSDQVKLRLNTLFNVLK